MNTVENGQQTQQKFPVGMRLILAFISWEIASTLVGLVGLVNLVSSWLVLGLLLPGVGVNIIIQFIRVPVLTFSFYGIVKKMKWARKLAIGWYILSMAYNLITLVYFLPQVFSVLPNAGSTALTLLSMVGYQVILGLIYLIVIIYLVRKRDFFTN